MPQKLLTVKEASDLLGIPKIKISELVDRGDLPAYKIGGKFVRFRKEQVEAIRNEILTRVGNGLPKARDHESPRFSHDASYSQSPADRVLDFFYFNDFYIAAAALTLLILFFIFS